MKKAPIIVVSIVVVIGLVIALTLGKKDKPTTDNTSSSSNSSSSGSNTSAVESDQAVPTNAVSIKNMSFSPKVITIPVGATVHWNNNDGVAHTVTADDGSFDSGSIAGKASFTHLFATAGTYKYHCSIHSGMAGTVIVRQQ